MSSYHPYTSSSPHFQPFSLQTDTWNSNYSNRCPYAYILPRLSKQFPSPEDVYDLFSFASYMYRLSSLNARFDQQSIKEHQWPSSLSDAKYLYSQFQSEIHHLVNNITCTCCACVFHDNNVIHTVCSDYASLSLLAIDPEIVPYDFSTDIPSLDQHHILVEKRHSF